MQQSKLAIHQFVVCSIYYNIVQYRIQPDLLLGFALPYLLKILNISGYIYILCSVFLLKLYCIELSALKIRGHAF